MATMQKDKIVASLDERASKPTSPPIQTFSATAPIPNTMPDPCPTGARRVWNKNRPKRAIQSKSRISNHDDGGTKTYPQKPHLAPGVPKTKLTQKGYCGPNEKIGKKKMRGGSVDVGTANAYPAEAHTSYG